MSVTVVAIPNPLRLSDRIVYKADAGVTVREVFPDAWERAYIRVNGDEAEPDRMLQVGDAVTLIRQPEAAAIPYIVNILVSIAISALFALLFPPPKPKQERDDESSPTYGFNGITNNRAEGQAIPIAYGRMKLGGTIANEFVEVQGLPPRSTLRQLISLGEGPYHAIGGVTEDTPASEPLVGAAIPREILINGNPAQNFSGIKVWIRLGTNEQELIPGFNETRSTFGVDAELTAPEFDSNDTSSFIPGFTRGGAEFLATNDALWDASAVSYDFNTEDIDGFAITLRMPEGWYRTDTTTGSTSAAFFRYQVRYIELDGGGSPITTGGFASDGYVRLPLVGPLALRQRSPFQTQVLGRFLNPQTYVPPTFGTALKSPSGGGSNATYAVGAAGFPNSHVPAFFSGFAWVKISAEGEQLILDNKSGNQGWQLGIFSTAFGTTSGSNVHTVLGFRFGNGSNTLNIVAGTLGSFGNPGGPPETVADGLFEAASVDQWVHVGFSYKQDDEVRLCVNGRQIPSRRIPNFTPSNIDVSWVRTQLHVGDDAFGTMLVDEVKLYNALLGGPDFAADYASGDGTTSAQLGLEDEMVFRSSFEDVAGTNESTSAGQWWATTPTLNGTATSGVEEGIVRAGESGELKRGQYRLEILRTSRGSTRSTIANAVEVQDMQSVISVSLTYPNSPLIGLEIDATEQLNDGIPTTTVEAECILCPVWDGESTTLPSIRFEWSANPAWISLELITNTRYGLGKFYDVRDVDLTAWLSWADYCDEIVFDGRARITIDNPGTAADADIYFDNALVDPDTGEARGEIWFEVGIEEVPTLPETWEVGSWLRFANMPTDAEVGVNNDIDSPDTTGYEIWEVSLLDGVWTVKCFWDRLAETDPWTSGNRLGADILTPTDLDDGTVEGGQHRFEFNGVFDKIGPAWDALLDIMAVGRAVPIPEGSRLSLRYSHPRDPVGVLTASNIAEGSFVVDFSSEKTRPNTMTLNILDREQGYEPVPVQVQTSDLEAVTNQSFIRQENRQLFGVTDAGQAERQGNYILGINRLQKRSGTFAAALDALPYLVGDVLRVTSEVLPRGFGGRLAAHAVSNRSASLSDREDFSGAAWTASSVTITTNVDTDPYGDTVADRIDGTGYVEQDLDFPVKGAGWISISVMAIAGTSSTPSLTLLTDRGTSVVTFDLSAVTASADDSFDLPARGTCQDVGGSFRYCTASFFVKPSDGLVETSTLTVRVHPLAGASTGTCVFSKIVATQAEHAASDFGNRGVVLDREVEIDSGVATTLTIQDFRGSVESGTVDTTMNPTGTYLPGETIFLAADPVTFPTRGAPYIVSTAANELLIELSGVSRGADMTASFEWVEYVPDAFADDPKEDGQRGGAIRRLDNVSDISTVSPASPTGLQSGDSLNEPSAGNFVPEISISWIHAAEGRTQLSGSLIYWRELLEDENSLGGWLLASRVEGLESEARLALPGLQVGALIELSVVATTRAYPNPSPDTGIRMTLKLRGLPWNAEGPTVLTAMIGGVIGTYEATYASAVDGPDRTDVLRTEIRRGGWILGQPVGVTAEGDRSLGPTPDVWEALTDVTVGRLHARALTRAITYSAEATLDASLVPTQDQSEVPDISLGATEEWETSEAGDWEAAVPDINGPLITGDLVQNAAGELEFDVSGLTGGYTTKFDGADALQLEQSRQPRPLLVMAAVEAEQVHPMQFGYAQFQIGSLEMQRWSFEGPTSPAADDSANCTLKIKIRTNSDGTTDGWSEYEPLVPGIYNAVEVQLRLIATRPDTTYNIRIKKFHHKVAIPARTLVEQSSRDLHARSEIL